MLSRFSHVWLSATPWTVARQAPLSMGFPRQEYWSGLPFPTPGDLPDPGVEPASAALAGRFFTTAPPGKPWWVLTTRCFHDGQQERSTYHTTALISHASKVMNKILQARLQQYVNQELPFCCHEIGLSHKYIIFCLSGLLQGDS